MSGDIIPRVRGNIPGQGPPGAASGSTHVWGHHSRVHVNTTFYEHGPLRTCPIAKLIPRAHVNTPLYEHGPLRTCPIAKLIPRAHVNTPLYEHGPCEASPLRNLEHPETHESPSSKAALCQTTRTRGMREPDMRKACANRICARHARTGYAQGIRELHSTRARHQRIARARGISSAARHPQSAARLGRALG